MPQLKKTGPWLEMISLRIKTQSHMLMAFEVGAHSLPSSALPSITLFIHILFWLPLAACLGRCYRFIKNDSQFGVANPRKRSRFLAGSPIWNHTLHESCHWMTETSWPRGKVVVKKETSLVWAISAEESDHRHLDSGYFMTWIITDKWNILEKWHVLLSTRCFPVQQISRTKIITS